MLQSGQTHSLIARVSTAFSRCLQCANFVLQGKNAVNEARDRRVASNPGSLFWILSRSFGEKSEGEPGRISHVIWWHRRHSRTLQMSETSHDGCSFTQKRGCSSFPMNPATYRTC